LFGLAHLVGISWPWIALAAAVLHFIIALVLVLIARSRIHQSRFFFFSASLLAELRKDREWLKKIWTQQINRRTESGKSQVHANASPARFVRPAP